MPFYLNPKLLASVIGAAILILGVLVAVSKRLGIALPASAFTWQSFLRGQGTIIAGFLLLGASIGWLSFRFLGQNPGQTTTEIRMAEYRQLALTDQPIFEKLDCDGYSHISIYAKSSAPQASTVSVRFIPDRTKPGEPAAITLEGVDSAWSRLDQTISAKHLTLIIGTGDQGTRATQADVLVFLSR